MCKLFLCSLPCLSLPCINLFLFLRKIEFFAVVFLAKTKFIPSTNWLSRCSFPWNYLVIFLRKNTFFFLVAWTSDFGARFLRVSYWFCANVVVEAIAICSFSVFYHWFCAQMTARSVMISRVAASGSGMCGVLFSYFFIDFAQVTAWVSILLRSFYQL